MNNLIVMALLLNLGGASVYANEKPVRMTSSGTFLATTINLAPDTVTDEENFAGNGTLGAFTFRALRADKDATSSTCSGPTKLYVSVVAGGGVFRFQDGSLLIVELTQGNACVDFAAQLGHFTVGYQITAGTGRFRDASGALTLTYTAQAVLADVANNAVFLAAIGEFTGKVSGLHMEEEQHDGSDSNSP